MCIIVLPGTASQHFSMLGIPLRGTFIALGESQINKKKKKNMFIDVQKSLFFEIYSVSCFQDHFQGVETGSRAYITTCSMGFTHVVSKYLQV